MFDAGVRVRLLPKPGSKTWHEVGDSLNNDRPLAPWYVVEQLLIQNCCLLGVQEVGEIAQPEHIYIYHIIYNIDSFSLYIAASHMAHVLFVCVYIIHC